LARQGVKKRPHRWLAEAGAGAGAGADAGAGVAGTMFAQSTRMHRFSLLLSCSLLVACGGKTADDTSPVPRDQFVSQMAHAICDGAQGCCTTNGFGYDDNACVTLTQNQLSALFADPSVTSAAYDGAAAGRCLAAIRDAVQSCNGKTDAVDAACAGVFHGTKAPGESCASAIECAPPADGLGSMHCISWSSSDGGSGTSGSACQLHLPPAEGSPCAGFADPPPPKVYDCSHEQGFYCGSDAKCHALGGVGAACSSSSACVDGATCDGSQCVAGAPAGSACSYAHGCDASSWCDFSTSKCVAKITNGGACAGATENACASGFCVKNKCVTSRVADAPTCVTP